MLGDRAPLADFVEVKKPARLSAAGRRGAFLRRARAAMAAALPMRPGSRTRSISSSALSPRASAPSAASAPATIRCSSMLRYAIAALYVHRLAVAGDASPPRSRRCASSRPSRSGASGFAANSARLLQRLQGAGPGARLRRGEPGHRRQAAPTRCRRIAMWNALLEAGVYVNIAMPPGTPGQAVPAALLGLGRAYVRATSTRSSRCSGRSPPQAARAWQLQDDARRLAARAAMTPDQVKVLIAGGETLRLMSDNGGLSRCNASKWCENTSKSTAPYRARRRPTSARSPTVRPIGF